MLHFTVDLLATHSATRSMNSLRDMIRFGLEGGTILDLRFLRIFGVHANISWVWNNNLGTFAQWTLTEVSKYVLCVCMYQNLFGRNHLGRARFKYSGLIHHPHFSLNNGNGVRWILITLNRIKMNLKLR